jgi:hypothetical protein
MKKHILAIISLLSSSFCSAGGIEIEKLGEIVIKCGKKITADISKQYTKLYEEDTYYKKSSAREINFLTGGYLALSSRLMDSYDDTIIKFSSDIKSTNLVIHDILIKSDALPFLFYKEKDTSHAYGFLGEYQWENSLVKTVAIAKKLDLPAKSIFKNKNTGVNSSFILNIADYENCLRDSLAAISKPNISYNYYDENEKVSYNIEEFNFHSSI